MKNLKIGIIGGGPTGIGVVWGKKELLNSLDPVYGGGDMIEEVHYDKATWAPVPHKFEAGTPPYVEAIGLGAAVDYLENLGMSEVEKHSDELREYGRKVLLDIDGVNVIHAEQDIAGCTFGMYVDGVHAADLSLMLDTHGVAVRAGHHCVQPFHRKLGIVATIAPPTIVKEPEKPTEEAATEGVEGEAVAGTEGAEAVPPKEGEAAKKDDKGKDQAGDKKQPAGKSTPDKKSPEKKEKK